MDSLAAASVGTDRALLTAPQQMPDRVVVLNDFSLMRGGATGIALASLRLLHDRGLPVTLITGDDAAGCTTSETAVSRASSRKSCPLVLIETTDKNEGAVAFGRYSCGAPRGDRVS